MTSAIQEFNDYRAKMNARIFESDSLVIKRFFNLDTNTYQEGALDRKTKELMGLGISLAMRCESCVKYHIGEAIALGATEKELLETFEIALIIGGSIVIPELRRAFAYMDEVFAQASEG